MGCLRGSSKHALCAHLKFDAPVCASAGACAAAPGGRIESNQAHGACTRAVAPWGKEGHTPCLGGCQGTAAQRRYPRASNGICTGRCRLAAAAGLERCRWPHHGTEGSHADSSPHPGLYHHRCCRRAHRLRGRGWRQRRPRRAPAREHRRGHRRFRQQQLRRRGSQRREFAHACERARFHGRVGARGTRFRHWRPRPRTQRRAASRVRCGPRPRRSIRTPKPAPAAAPWLT